MRGGGIQEGLAFWKPQVYSRRSFCVETESAVTPTREESLFQKKIFPSWLPLEKRSVAGIRAKTGSVPVCSISAKSNQTTTQHKKPDASVLLISCGNGKRQASIPVNQMVAYQNHAPSHKCVSKTRPAVSTAGRVFVWETFGKNFFKNFFCFLSVTPCFFEKERL